MPTGSQGPDVEQEKEVGANVMYVDGEGHVHRTKNPTAEGAYLTTEERPRSQTRPMPTIRKQPKTGSGQGEESKTAPYSKTHKKQPAVEIPVLKPKTVVKTDPGSAPLTST